MSKNVMKKSRTAKVPATSPSQDQRKPFLKRRKPSPAKTIRETMQEEEPAPDKKPVDRKKHVKAIKEAVKSLESVPALSYVLATSEGINSIGPNLISAIDLTVCTFNEASYRGPYPESQFEAEKTDAARRREEIVAGVQAQMRRLAKSGAVFVCLWQAVGETEVHVEYYTDDMLSDVEECLEDEMSRALVP